MLLVQLSCQKFLIALNLCKKNKKNDKTIINQDIMQKNHILIKEMCFLISNEQSYKNGVQSAFKLAHNVCFVL